MPHTPQATAKTWRLQWSRSTATVISNQSKKIFKKSIKVSLGDNKSKRSGPSAPFYDHSGHATATWGPAAASLAMLPPSHSVHATATTAILFMLRPTTLRSLFGLATAITLRARYNHSPTHPAMPPLSTATRASLTWSSDHHHSPLIWSCHHHHTTYHTQATLTILTSLCPALHLD